MSGTGLRSACYVRRMIVRMKLPGGAAAAEPCSDPASINFLTTDVGATNAAGHIAAVAGQCALTRFVLGGFSQEAALMAMLAGVPPLGDTVGLIGSAPPLAPELADRVTAVAVFGNPSARFGTPLSTTVMARTTSFAKPDRMRDL